MNIGYCGSDSTALATKWNCEYGATSKFKVRVNATLWNYELAPNAEASSENIVSKHCIVSSDDLKSLNNSGGFYSDTFYYHFNQFENFSFLCFFFKGFFFM